MKFFQSDLEGLDELTELTFEQCKKTMITEPKPLGNGVLRDMGVPRALLKMDRGRTVLSGPRGASGGPDTDIEE